MATVDTSSAVISYARKDDLKADFTGDRKQLRVTSFSLQQTNETLTSEEIVAGAQTRASRRTGIRVRGTVGYEFSGLSQDDLLQAAFRASFSKTPEKVGNSAVTAVDGTGEAFTVDADGTDFVAGHIVYAENFGEAGNNGFHVVTASAGTSVTVGGSDLTEEASPPATAQIKVVGFEGAAGDIQTAISPNRITSTALDFTTIGIDAGSKLKIGGSAAGTQFDTTALYATVRVVSVSANSIEVEHVPTGWAADAGAGKTIRIWLPDVLTNSNEKHGLFFSEQITAGEWQSFNGCRINTFSMSAQPGSAVTGDFGVLGLEQLLSTVAPGTGAVATAPDTEIVASEIDVDEVYLDGSPAALTLTSIEMSTNVDADFQPGLTGDGVPVDIKIDRLGLTGSFAAYYTDDGSAYALLDRIRTFGAGNLSFRLKSGNTHYVFDLLEVKPTGEGGSPNPGAGQDRLITFNFTSEVDGTYAKMAKVSRFYYAE